MKGAFYDLEQIETANKEVKNDAGVIAMASLPLRTAGCVPGAGNSSRGK
jgi:hypothetical protein